MAKGTRDRRQVARIPRAVRAAVLDHLPPGVDRQPDRTDQPAGPPPIDPQPAAARGRETRGEVETATMRHLEESEQGPK